MALNSSKNLDRLFYPKSVAVVGASPNKGKIWSNGNLWIAGSIEQDYQGRIYPVHPTAEYVLGYKAYKNIREIPDEIDLAIFTVPAKFVIPLLEECIEKKVKFVHILTAGFTETGRDENTEHEKELIELVRKSDIGLVGPNCMGVYCPDGGMSWSEGFPTTSGPVGLFSQSGQIASIIVRGSIPHRIRFSKVVSFGNASGLQPYEYLNYLGQDDKTKIIGSYIEGLKDGRSFFETAKTITRKKPLIIWKGGQTEGGSRATQSHTAAIAGSHNIWESMVKQTGIISVNSMDEMIYTISALQKSKLPKGPNVAILGGAGGGSVIMTDAAEKEGLKVPYLSDKTIQKLEEFVPVEGTSSKNPLDIIGAISTRENFLYLIDLLREDPKIDSLIFTMPMFFFSSDAGRDFFHEFIQITIEGCQRLEKPMLLVIEGDKWEGLEILGQEAEDLFRQAKIATFPNFQIATRVLSVLNKYNEFLSSPED